jgi:branched-subunit amino acid aminotransferase/4-amino-4-deoxychorismate lyase
VAHHPAQVAQQLGVPVELRAPSISELDTFEAAFVSSTSRLLLPVHEVDAPDLQPPAHRVLPPSELAQRLEAAVAAEIAACSEPVA